MQKPHEQEWTHEEAPYGAGTRVVLKDGPAIIAVFPASEPTSAARRRPRAQLAAAAPDMARALLANASFSAENSRDGSPCWCTTFMVNAGEPHGKWCQDSRAALKKAGVL